MKISIHSLYIQLKNSDYPIDFLDGVHSAYGVQVVKSLVHYIKTASHAYQVAVYAADIAIDRYELEF